MSHRGPLDGFHATVAAVSKTCLVRFDNNQYSVAARAVGGPVNVRAYAERIVIRQDGESIAEHPWSFAPGQVVYDPWHYVPILARKPGALRNGAPFKGWRLPDEPEPPLPQSSDRPTYRRPAHHEEFEQARRVERCPGGFEGKGQHLQGAAKWRPVAAAGVRLRARISAPLLSAIRTAAVWIKSRAR